MSDSPAVGYQPASVASSATPSSAAQPKRFHVLNLGCKVNRVESDTMAASCLAAGGVASQPQQADVVIVNTCTVTAEADAKTRKAVRRMASLCPGPVVVTGCAAAINPDELRALAPNVVVEPVHLKAAQLAVQALGSSAQALAVGSGKSIELRAGDQFKTRMDIKIQDGCENACTYCIVHKARGAAVSTPVDDVVAEVSKAAQLGVGEVVLTGINLGSYRDGDVRLPQLLQRLLSDTDIGRVRISSIEPPHVTQELVQVMAANPQRICAHLHVPLQSGCDRTLRAMGRSYDAAEFARRMQLVRQACPNVALSTDVIVGFPQESDGDFAQSLAFCREMGFMRMHVFRYSRRPGTPAAQMPGQVDPQVSATRAALMRELSQQMALADAQARVGGDELVLMMESTLGMAASYHDVVLEQPQPKGALVPVRIVGVDAEARLLAQPLPR